jgi:NADH:ubiquinone oxidoreductase subunit 4 (subunit M)
MERLDYIGSSILLTVNGLLGRFGVNFTILEINLSIDNLNIVFIMLTNLVFPIITNVSDGELLINELLLLTYLVLGVIFSQYNYLIFIILFEVILMIVFYLLIFSLSDYKIRSSFYLFIFSIISTILFSISLLLFILIIVTFISYILLIACILFLFSFGIKLPIWPFHD